MTKKQRISAFSKLGSWMSDPDQDTFHFIKSLVHKNPWYTSDNVLKQFIALGSELHETNLERWLIPYEDFQTDRSVGLILAGNLPLVGFHDILCTLIMGFVAKIKVSSDDAGLTTFVLNKLREIEPDFGSKIQLVDKLENFDLVIATGSNNSARYFEFYFGNKPHIIRKNRNSIAVLNGKESQAELAALGNDIFDYFGLGCRSVSKIFIPQGYEISTFFEAIETKKEIKEHFKYNNNYDYNKSIYLINRDKHYDNGFLLLKEDKAIPSPLSVIHYEEYTDIEDVRSTIQENKENIQCIVSSTNLDVDAPIFAFGKSQAPALNDFADNINTLDFLYNNR